MLKTFALLLLPSLAAAGTPAAQAHDHAAETRSEVPALTEFHEVIFPLWHEAWPHKNYKMMRDLLPQVKDHLARITAARLPGILHEKQDAWDKGVAELKEVVAQYEAAAGGGPDQALADAVETLHERYEALVRLIRPAMKELDAFHVVLYRVYHHELPGKAFDKIAISAGEMADRCAGLAKAPVPKRFTGLEPKLGPAIASLCEATTALKTTAAGNDHAATAKAVETVHAAYEGVAALFQ
jgi:hypothetical protein